MGAKPKLDPSLSPVVDRAVERAKPGWPGLPPGTPNPEETYRRIAGDVLETAASMGLRIAEAPGKPPEAREADELLARIGQHAGDIRALRQLWLTRDPQQWANLPDAKRMIGEYFLKAGEPLLAHDVFREALTTSSDVRLRQLCALSLLRSGAEQSALKLLKELVAEGSQDEETLGLLARVEKGLAFLGADPAARTHHLRQACELYKDSFRKTGGYWTGVNAATLALVLGDHAEASSLAVRVREICDKELARVGGEGQDAFWALATLGEVSLILGNETDAEKRYTDALRIGVHRLGDIASMRRNARMVAKANGLQFPIDRVLKMPCAYAFTGYTGGHSGGAEEELTEKSLAEVRTQIEETLAGAPAFCFASGACGSEILFLEANRKNGGENHLILPCPAEQFIRERVEPGGGDWIKRFRALHETAAAVYALSKDRSSKEPIQIQFTNLQLLGHGRLKAIQLDTRLEGLAVRSGLPAKGAEAAGDAVTAWRKRGLDVAIIESEIAATPKPTLDVPLRQARPEQYVPEIRSMLFSDAVGFSQLSEAQVAVFFSQFSTLVGKLLHESEYGPIVADTWGDGLYVVFQQAADAGRFSLELRERIRKVDWAATGLPNSLSLRIALHAGPVYSCTDPITGLPTFIGTNVTRAARLEPITPAGEVYASADFAALAAAENVDSFSCEYVGIIPAAKGFGEYQTYVLRSRVRS
jgi:class 3 adenylate cyclase